MGNVVSAVRGPRTDNSPNQHASPQNIDTTIPLAQTTTPQSPIYPSLRRNTFSGPRRRQAQQHSTLHTQLNDGNDDETPDRSYEQEDSPLFAASQQSSIEARSGRPLTWRHSTISRLGSRILPDSVNRGLSNSDEEMTDNDQTSRQGLLSRNRPDMYRRSVSSNNGLSTVGPYSRTTSESRGDTSRGSIRRLFRSNADRLDNDIDLSIVASRDSELSLSNAQSVMPVHRRRGTRFSRMRNSFSSPLSTLLRPSQSTSLNSARTHLPPPRSSRTPFVGDSDELLSQSFREEMHQEPDESVPRELDAVEPEARNLLSNSRNTAAMNTIRRIPHGFRSRSTRLIRRGEHPPLSQVLQLAAAAIAAQLSGASNEASGGARPSAGNTFDGSIHNFVQTLQDAASAQTGGDVDLNANDGELPPVNFMRVFQFPNDENGTPLSVPASQQLANDVEVTNANGGNDRSVTLVLVGVRSMPNVHDNSTGDGGTLAPGLDTLLSLPPFLPPANIIRNSSSGALFRRSDSRYRPQNRRHSMNNFNFPQQYESQRHLGSRQSTTRTGEGSSNPAHNSSMLMSESPPGPNPPPSTPADIRSGNATPNRRPSSASMAHAPGLPDLNEDQDNITTNLPAESAFNTARHRRRSDSEFARRPELSSGNSRRNGVVEPDRPPPGAGRSWLIYVVGTNVAPNHPAFTMPSLFTENPTYEDMQMLSTLLGPVKPPVASQEDLETAGGLYRVLFRDGALVAEDMTDANAQLISINPGDRCLICLSDYEENDDVRQIYSCRHMFHRECIDEWLTTGRNSCPMCRGEGVKESSNSTSHENAEAVDGGLA